jgi:transcriptional regulator with XRE-family HTH domain
MTRDYSFGGWIRHLRIQNKITLREAAKLAGMDAGNLSKLERSELPPPKTASKVLELCYALNIVETDFLKSLAFQHHLAELRKEFCK